jgi:hypothetical protein
MLSFGPAGALLGLGAMSVESATQAVMDRINPKIAQIPVAQYSAELQPLLAELLARAKAQVEAGQEITVDIGGALEAFYLEKSEPVAAELVRAEMESLSADPDWGERLGT